jgi:hypothetical protein
VGLRDRASGRTLYVASSAAGRFCQAPAPLNRCTGFFSAPLFAPPPVNSRCVSSSHPFSVSAGRNQIPVHRQGVCPARGGTFSPSLCALCLCSLPPPHPRYDCWVFFLPPRCVGKWTVWLHSRASFRVAIPWLTYQRDRATIAASCTYLYPSISVAHTSRAHASLNFSPALVPIQFRQPSPSRRATDRASGQQVRCGPGSSLHFRWLNEELLISVCVCVCVCVCRGTGACGNTSLVRMGIAESSDDLLLSCCTSIWPPASTTSLLLQF